MKGLSRSLLRAGYVPLPWFLFWSTLGGWLAPGYSAVSQQVSELGLGSGLPRTFEGLAGMGTGVAFIAFAIGLYLESDRKAGVGAAAWALFGIAMGSNGIWPMGSPMHGLYAVGIVNLIAPAMSFVECGKLREDRVAYVVTAVASVAGVVYLWLNLVGLDPLAFRGATQRIFSSINSSWPFVVAGALLRSKGRAT
jgi:hypothetical membrane protein